MTSFAHRLHVPTAAHMTRGHLLALLAALVLAACATVALVLVLNDDSSPAPAAPAASSLVNDTGAPINADIIRAAPALEGRPQGVARQQQRIEPQSFPVNQDNLIRGGTAIQP